jgi:2,3-dihydroxybiphenyl 1,2-dioxygenase
VHGLISFADPAGNRLEAFHGQAAVEPFRPGRAISGFRTGPLGMGYAVLTVPQIDEMGGLYRDLLGFRVSDYILGPFKAFFFHINPRHHSLALIETGRHGLHHLMVELHSFDDVGQGYGFALGEPERIATTLRRHPNDLVTSFYLRSPSGFMLEYGWGGREVDPTRWAPAEVTVGPSLWGHDRISPEQREASREMRLRAAAEGQRVPVQVIEGNYQRIGGVCRWWEGMAGRG